MVGVDLGVTRLATWSDGTGVEHSCALAKARHQLRRWQKEVSRQQKASANRRPASWRLGRAQARAKNLRRDARHQATTTMAQSHGRVIVENLEVRNLTRRTAGSGRAAKAALNRAWLDALRGELRRLLSYPARGYGCEVAASDPAYTNQRCAACGRVAAGKRPPQSVFQHWSCRHKENADCNAAINSWVAGSCPDTVNACGADVRRSAQSAMKQESAVAS